MSNSRTSVWHVTAPNSCMGGYLSKAAFYFTPSVDMHVKARSNPYPRTTDILRYAVPNEKVPWKTEFPDYKPTDYTAPSVSSGPVWADPEVENLDPAKDKFPKWNALDGKINRKSHSGSYDIDQTCNCPLNPKGRTGLRGRGLLGRWGPNHAADPIVTRWKHDAKGKTVMKDGKPVLQVIVIQRRDSGEWALPGGMVDVGEVITMTIRREFGEEAMGALTASPAEKKEIEEQINKLFAQGTEIYRGYVDDPRNTDNAWMETIAINFHDATGSSVGRFKLNAGDDAVGVQWMDLSRHLQLYASHVDFLQETARRHGANW